MEGFEEIQIEKTQAEKPIIIGGRLMQDQPLKGTTSISELSYTV
jgi:hypothetical protein